MLENKKEEIDALEELNKVGDSVCNDLNAISLLNQLMETVNRFSELAAMYPSREKDIKKDK